MKSSNKSNINRELTTLLVKSSYNFHKLLILNNAKLNNISKELKNFQQISKIINLSEITFYTDKYIIYKHFVYKLMKIGNNTIQYMVISMITAIAGITAAAIFTGLAASTVFANHEFAANLTGQEEVPPVDTQALGEAIFVPIQPRNETIDFHVNASGIQAVTQAHIHSGSPGENGPIIVTLFTLNPVQNGVSINGSIAANNLEGPMQGKTVAELIDAIKNNTTYVNVHTEQNPDGEIRGQLADIP